MKKAVLMIALLFFFHYSFSLQYPICKTLLNVSDNNVFDPISSVYDGNFLSIISDTPNDTTAYLFLDPESKTIYLSLMLDNSAKISLLVLDIIGNVVWSIPETRYDMGKVLLSGALDLNHGQYIVKVLKNGNVYKTQKILLIK
ncbi:MAG TPA: hypothetical protein PKK00_03300 [Bacteroidales bacterium]|nr:hypothetical protein [Bacteroidales bacterium]HPS15652.1 hypothetical protein [Bacteroidales bacterium]